MFYNLKVHAIRPEYLPKPVKSDSAHLLAATITFFSEYSHYADVFFEQKARALLKHRPQDLSIEIISGAMALFGPFYNLSAPELETLQGVP